MMESKLTNSKRRNFGSFFKFAIVGGLGTVTNLLFFYVFVDVFDWQPLPVSTLCYFISAIQNYLINHFWTFQDKLDPSAPSLSALLKFLLASTAGLAVNLLCLKFTLGLFPAAVYSQFLGIAAGLIFNYVIVKFFVFNK